MEPKPPLESLQRRYSGCHKGEEGIPQSPCSGGEFPSGIQEQGEEELHLTGKPEALAKAVDGPFERALRPISSGLAERMEGITETKTTGKGKGTNRNKLAQKSFKRGAKEHGGINSYSSSNWKIISTLFNTRRAPSRPTKVLPKKLTQDQEILSLVEGYKVQFLCQPTQEKVHRQTTMNSI